MFSIHSSPIGQLGSRDTGGMSVYIRDAAHALAQLGHSVDIYTGRSQAECMGGTIALSDKVNLIQLNPSKQRKTQSGGLYQNLPDLFEEVEIHRTRHMTHYDIIHSHYWLSGLMGKMAHDSWEIPHVMTFHTLAAVKNRIGIGRPEPPLRLNSERILAHESQLIISATERERYQLKKYYGVKPDKVVSIPCGVDMELFRPIPMLTARNQLGLPKDGLILLYVGRIDPLKGVDRLLEAAAYLKTQQTVKVIVVGGDTPPSNEEIRLHRLVASLNIQDQVTFAGRVEQGQLPLYYSAVDALVIPSYYESFGLVALESLACGTPVISTSVGAIDDIVKGEGSGHVSESNSARALAENIERFLFSTKTRKTDRVSANIRDSIREFSWSAVADRLSNAYTNICNSGEMI
jgi:D-inositol-3-phosphate glycosyltransferase